MTSGRSLTIGGIGEAGENIGGGEVGKIGQDCLGVHAGGKVGEDIIDGDAHGAGAGFAATFVRFEGDDVLVVHGGEVRSLLILVR